MTMTLIQKLLRRLSQAEDLILSLLLSALLLFSVAQILLRNLADSGFIWAEPLVRILVLWVALVGAMVATRDGSHININLLGHWLKGSSKMGLAACSHGVSAVVCALLAWHSLQFVQFEKEDQIIAFLDYPVWWFESIIPFAFALMTLRFILSAFNCWMGKHPGEQP